MTHAFAMVGRPDTKKRFWVGVLVYMRVFTRKSGFLTSKNMHIWLVGDSKLPHDVSVCECCVSALQWTSDMFHWTHSVCQVTDRHPFDTNLSKWQLIENGWEHSFTHDSTHSMLMCMCGLISAHRTWIKLRSLDRFDGKCIWQTMEVGHNYCFTFLTDD